MLAANAVPGKCRLADGHCNSSAVLWRASFISGVEMSICFYIIIPTHWYCSSVPKPNSTCVPWAQIYGYFRDATTGWVTQSQCAADQGFSFSAASFGSTQWPANMLLCFCVTNKSRTAGSASSLVRMSSLAQHRRSFRWKECRETGEALMSLYVC